jgi:hypothetical protein
MTDGSKTDSLPPPASAPAESALAPKPGESQRAFDAFPVYVELGPKRRLHAVVKQTGAGLDTAGRSRRIHDRQRAVAEELLDVTLRFNAANPCARRKQGAKRCQKVPKSAIPELLVGAASRSGCFGSFPIFTLGSGCAGLG